MPLKLIEFFVFGCLLSINKNIFLGQQTYDTIYGYIFSHKLKVFSFYYENGLEIKLS